ncbi:MAG: PqqD family protein [Planctomycetes bacterium]|nr:PqqD family protein [Planctomycetota bacterium]
MSLSPASRISIPEKTLMRVVDGQAVILSLGTERYYGLDEIGTRIWELLASGKTLAETAEAMAKEFDAPAATIESDIRALLAELVREGLIEPVK